MVLIILMNLVNNIATQADHTAVPNGTLHISDILRNNFTNFSDLSNFTDFDNLTCKEYEKHAFIQAKLILNSICGTIIAFLGLCGNVTTAVVLTRPGMRSPNNLYLTLLALFDTLLILMAVMLYTVEFIYEYTDNLAVYHVWLSYVRYAYALSHVAQTGSVYITVSVTFERYLAVLHPKRAKIMCTHDKATFTVAGVVLFAIMFNCTKYFEVRVEYFENCTGFAEWRLGPSDLMVDGLYSTVYSLCLTQFVMVFFPFIVLCAANTAIVCRVRRSLKRLSWIQRGRKRHQLKEKSRDATRVSIVIVLVFLVCNSLGFVVTVMENIYSSEVLKGRWPTFYEFAREMVNFLAVVNSSINFVIYCIFGQDFRQELVHIWGCKRYFNVFVPVANKYTADNFMTDDEARRPSVFARYMALVRNGAAGPKKFTLRNSDSKSKTLSGTESLANLRNILANARRVNNKEERLGDTAVPMEKIYATATDEDRVTFCDYDLDDEHALAAAVFVRGEQNWQQGSCTSPHFLLDTVAAGRRRSIANAEALLPRDSLNLPRPSTAGSGNYLSPYQNDANDCANLTSRSSWSLRDRVPSTASTATTKTTNATSSKLSPSDTEPLAPFLLGMLITAAPTMRRVGFETAMKNYEDEETNWV